MSLSTHILDTTRGRPAPNVEVVLEIRDSSGWKKCASDRTNDDGRVKALGDALSAAVYRITFLVEPYLLATHGGGFYPEVSIVFSVQKPNEHYHVPLLLNPYGYSTYRGS